MKMKLCFVMALFSIAFAGCEKAEDGEKGPQGEPGNANVSSTLHVIQPSDWNVNVWGLTCFLTDSGITTDIINEGSVHMYLYAGSMWHPLPFTTYNGNLATLVDGSFAENNFTVMIFRSDGLQPTVPSLDLTFRVVTISGATRMANPDLDYSDYTAVSARFGLD